MGELRHVFVIDQRGPRRERHDHRVGLRSVVRVDGRTARLRHAGQRRHRFIASGLSPAPFTPASPAPAPTSPLTNNANTAPSYIAGRVRVAAAVGRATIRE